MKKSIFTVPFASLCVFIALSLCGCSCAGGQQETPPPAQPQAGSSAGNSQSVGENAADDRVIVDNSECVFVVTGTDDSSRGYTVEVRCENRGSRTLMFSLSECSVNGWMVDPFWAEEVSAGNRSNSKIVFDRDDLDRCGITSVDEIEFGLHIYDSDDWEADPVVSDDYTLYPTGLGPGRIDIPQRTAKEGEQVIIDNNRCSFIIESVDPDGIMGYTLTCYLENKTDDELMFSWDDVAVNGTMIDPFWAASVEDGKRAYAEISFFNSDFEENGIDSVEKIEFRLRVYDSDDWDADDMIANEVFVYTP